MTVENYAQVVAVNMTGVWLCMKYELPHLLKNGGAIVNNSSSAGVNGYANVSAYSASKHGVIGLTKTAALEYAQQGVRVNAIAPGMFETPLTSPALADPELRGYMEMMHPIGRIAQPEEAAGAVVWLCSDEASFVTGHVMLLDGGWNAR
jgi:NAD(P)-dependent dehydrogenase (short-subunit alcohol dehydrogenase family)